MDQAQCLREWSRKGVNNQMSTTQKPLKITAITGGKGGVGKSNISLNLSLSLQQMGEKVCLFDGDFGLANIDVLLGQRTKFHLGHVLKGEKTLKEIVLSGPKGISWVPGASGVKELSSLNNEQTSLLAREAKAFGSNYSRLVIDTAAGISSGVMDLLRLSGDIVVVITPEPTSLTDAYALIKLIRKEGIQTPLKVVLNMVKNQQEGERLGLKIEQICKLFLDFSPEILGVINMSPELQKSVRQQKPLVLLNPNDETSNQIRLIASKLFNDDERRDDFGSFFNSMASLLR